MSAGSLEDANLREFPFEVVPPAAPTHIWASRPSFRLQLQKMVETWHSRRSSAIYLMWAELGAGKTHALRYLEYLVSKATPPSVAVYCDMPESIADFRDVYRQIVPRIPGSVLTDAIVAFRGARGEDWLDAPELQGDRDTPRALWMLTGQEQSADVARKWLRADRLTASDTRLIGGSASIRTSTDAIRVLSCICRIVVAEGKWDRFVLMLDEFQRIGQINSRRIQDINSGINTVFNSCPNGLVFLLTYSFGDPKSIDYMVTPEVRSRVTARYQLPNLSEDEAALFVSDLLASYSADPESPPAMRSESVGRIVGRIAAESSGRITPRRLMKGFGGVLDAALQLEDVRFPLQPEVVETLYSGLEE